MDRNIVYPGSIPLDTDVLQVQRNVMLALGSLAQATLGTTTVVDGLACTQTTVAGMTVNVAPGSILSLTTVDATAFGSLSADTTDPLVKVGYNSTTTNLSGFSAPGTTGQSINYLIQAAFQESDATPVVLPYYNAANPAVAFSGPANAGTPQNTQRLQRVNLTVKAGSPATTGTQTTPAPDGGFVGLYVVTVAFAQATIVNANIAQLATAPFVDAARQGRGVQPGRLLAVRSLSAGTYVPTPGTVAVEVEVIGGSGAGGGTQATIAAQSAAGGGGGSGARGRGYFTSAFSGVTVTIGAGGAAVSGAAGGNAGTTSFGALMSAPGGLGGGVATSVTPPAGALGGAGGATAVGGYMNEGGQAGGNGFNISTTGVVSGAGGGPGGGAPQFFTNPGATGIGHGGGSGAAAAPSQSAQAGGAGSAGQVIVREYS